MTSIAQNNRSLSSRIALVIKVGIIIAFLLGNFLNLQTGWADNGDYTRIMTWFTSSPSNMENWPAIDTPESQLRFFQYWIPNWKLDFPGTSEMFSSSLLLWFPGILINRYIYSADTLSTPLMSIGARSMLLLLILLILIWIDKRSRYPMFHYFTIAFPLVLLFTTTDVAAFFNTFYQENGAIVFIPLLLAIVISGQWITRDWKFYLIYFFTCCFVTTSKIAFFYWPIITLPFVVDIRQLLKKPLLWIPVSLALAAIPIAAGFTLTKVPLTEPVNQYNSLFTGALVLSSNPQAHLERIGIPEAIECVGIDYYSKIEGHACLEKYKDHISFRAVLPVLWNEPQIFFKQWWVLSQTLQNYSLYLGKYAYQDDVVRHTVRLNLWSEMKKAYFPKGIWLLISLPIFAFIIFQGWNKTGLIRDMSIVSALCLIAFLIDSLIQIWGDGHRDLLKHLFIANMLYDGLLIFSTNTVLTILIASVTPRLRKMNPLLPSD